LPGTTLAPRVLSRNSHGGSTLSLTSLTSGGNVPPQTPKRGPAKKKKGLLNASEYQEATSSQSKVEGIFISSRTKQKKGEIF